MNENLNVVSLIISTAVIWGIPRLLEQFFSPGTEKKLPWARWHLGHFIAAATGGFWLGLSGVLGLQVPGNIHVNIVWGLGMGVAQWVVLRPYLNVGPFWIFLTALGWLSVPFCEIVQLPQEIHWIVAGLCVGVLQSLYLMRTCTRSGWWLATNLVAWFIAITIGTASGFFMSGSQVVGPQMAWVLGWGVVGLVGSLILGIPLVLISPKQQGQTELQKSVPQEKAAA